MWVVRLLETIFPGRFLAGRTTRLPMVGRLVYRWLFDGDDVIFLPRDDAVRTVTVDEAVDQGSEIALPSRVVEHFVERARVHWIMDSCLCRAGEGCHDYPIELGCLFLGEAALGINPELGRRVTREEALAHVRRCREAGLVHVIGRNKLDTLWLGVRPGRRLLTICNCCPCCCLWGVIPHVTPRISERIQRMPGLTVSINGQCVGCGTCTEGVCFADAVHLKNGRAAIDGACRGCARCVDVCPHSAISLSIDDSQFVDRTIKRIESLVDLD